MLFTVVSSNFHLELNPRYAQARTHARTHASCLILTDSISDLGIYDRVIVQDVIKGIAQTQQIDSNAKHQFKGKKTTMRAQRERELWILTVLLYIVVIIDQADELTREAQAALRRTMEKYTSSMRLILCCNSLSKIIAPVRSRCLLMRVGRPETTEIVRVLQDVAHKEGFSLPKELAVNIAEHAERNMRAALLALESTAVRQ